MALDFLESIKSGMEKANQAELAKREVSGVFDEINNQLSAFDGDKIQLSVERAQSPMATMAKVTEAFSNKVSEFLDADHVRLIMRRDSAVAAEEVARWRQHINGYPCTVSFEGQDYNCSTADDLRSAFREMFASVSFGRRLIRCLNKINHSVTPPDNDGV